ncbi:MAG: class I SAM-dependent methyltransferase [Mycobacterium sp.]
MPRTDDDSWDLASSVGATATMVAAARAIATKDDTIDDPFAEPLVRAVGVDFLTRWANGELAGVDLDVEGSPFGLAQMPAAMAARTRYFDQFFADAAAAGIRQAVILASGLDARSYRLEWPAGMVVFEIDQPEVIAFKQTTLAGLGAEPTADVRAVAIDLRNDWPTALTDAGFDPSKPSAWIAEGLFGYLPPEAQDRLLDAVTELGAPGSRIATEAVPNSPGLDLDAARAKMREATEKWREHGFDLDFSELGFDGERHDVGDYLDGRGWTSVGTPMGELLTANGFEGIPASDGDQPTMSGVIYYTSTLKG